MKLLYHQALFPIASPCYKPLPSDLFTVLPPTVEAVPIVANLPHSGLQVPAHIADTFIPEHLSSLPNSDWHLQQLYDFLPTLGITVLQANYSRYVVDLNRALKPPLLGSFWSAVVAEDTAYKRPIYQRKPSHAEVRSRIDEYYHPYHHQLAALLNEAIARFGQVTLLDLHSFMGLIDDEVCLGNANGQTCTPSLIESVASCFTQQEYQVVQNKVFTGGYITRHYGMQPNVSALQIELRYPTYLPADQIADYASDPKQSLQKSSPQESLPAIPHYQGPAFNQARDRLRQVFSAICSIKL